MIKDPKNKISYSKSHRGGSWAWLDHMVQSRSAWRYSSSIFGSMIGFRVFYEIKNDKRS